MNKNILITGGSGLIGTRLTELFLKSGNDVAHLGRTAHHGHSKNFLWDVQKRTIDPHALAGIDAIVHLAGAGIGDKRWTRQRKKEILRSRIDSTGLLYDELKKGNHNVRVFVSASAVGYYGTENNETSFSEEDKQGDGFLADVVAKWEQAIDKIATLGIRVVKIRAGIVLSEKGGALKEMMRPVKLYAGSTLGTGRQMLSWIHIDDLCRIFIKAIEDERMQGIYNAVAPNPIDNKLFTRILADTLQRPILLPPVPAFVLKVLLGEMADLVLKGQKVSSRKIQSAGYEFRFKSAEDALKDLLRRSG